MTRTIIITHPAGRETVLVEDQNIVLNDYVEDRYPGATWQELDAVGQLDALKNSLKAAVDEAAEAERLKYITPGAGQAMTYQRKVEEGRRVIATVAASDEIDAADYPLLSASVGIDGNTLADVAQLVIQMDAAWAQVGAAIEAVRLGAKKAIGEANSEAAAMAVHPVWPQAPTT